MQETALIDDMQGIFKTASEAYARGEMNGIHKLYQVACAPLARLSNEYEKTNNVEGFRAAEAACEALLAAFKKLRDEPLEK